MADRSVRPAIPDDAAAIAAVHRAAVAADHPELGAAVLDALGSPAAEAIWADSVRRPPSAQHRILTALDGARVVGFAVLAPPDDADVSGRELFELRVHPDAVRDGHGSRMLAAAVDVLTPEGVAALVCWVVPGSPLEGLLEATGWAPDGSTRELDAAGTRLPQRRWATSLVG